MSEHERLSHEEFVRRAILRLRQGDHKGIHTVYSGFNDAFRNYYPNDDPIEVTNKLAQEGKIVIRPIRGGVILYLPEEVPLQSSRGENVLKKILN